MARLTTERKAQVIGALIEGNSICSTERMTGVHRDTIGRGSHPTLAPGESGLQPLDRLEWTEREGQNPSQVATWAWEGQENLRFYGSVAV